MKKRELCYKIKRLEKSLGMRPSKVYVLMEIYTKNGLLQKIERLEKENEIK